MWREETELNFSAFNANTSLLTVFAKNASSPSERILFAINYIMPAARESSLVRGGDVDRY